MTPLMNKTAVVLSLLALAACRGSAGVRPGPDGGVVVENDYVTCVIGADARVARFADRRTGLDVAAKDPPAPCARMRMGGKEQAASSAAFRDGLLRLRFGDTGGEADLRITANRTHMVWEVVSARGEGIEELVFADIPLALRGAPGEPIEACALALNLRTNVAALPAPSSRLAASCCPKFGLAGARAALVACPPSERRRILQEAVAGAPDLPHSPLGGPWAMDAPLTRGSYLFDFGQLNEKTVDDWIRVVQSLGFKQIDFHGGGSFRFGDCEVNRAIHPRGREGFRAAIDKLHAAGIAAGLHTYAFFIDKRCPWVTPVPDPRLASDATFSLAEDLASDATTIPVAEATKGTSTVTGFFVRNSVTLRIDDELVEFAGVTASPPHAFTGCRRGVLGTRAAPHARGAKAHHLKECFGLFVPDPETTLLADVAQRTADLYNACGFDMIYMDALDGEDILGGPAWGWHYGSRFVFEVFQRLRKPALMEMSTFHHHLWTVRSRTGAWDHPRRAHKEFIDIHVKGNENSRRMFLPANLGWWAVETWTGPQGEPTFTDDIEYLCAKAVGTDASLSLMGINPQNAGVGAMPRLAEVFRRYETLRLSGAVPESVKEQLRRPGEEFRLATAPGGGWAFRPARSDRRSVLGASDAWKVRNPFGRGPARLRIEALMSAGPFEAAGNVVLADAESAGAFADRGAAPGVTAELSACADTLDGKSAALRFTATNSTSGARASWAKAGRTFSPPLNLSERQGLGLWIHGDGQGEVLNVQLRSPDHLVVGIGEHYVVVDFTGWRYVALVEPEGRRFADYVWPYGDPYAIYRESVNYGQVSSLTLWLNNIPPGKTVTCRLGPIKAVPLASGVVRNPAVAIGGRSIAFPVALESGAYLEADTTGAARHYAPDGALKADIKADGAMPEPASGENEVRFTCESSPEGPPPRAAVTVCCEGEALPR